MNLFGCDIDFVTIDEAELAFTELTDEILEVQCADGRGIGRLRRNVFAVAQQFFLRCSKVEYSLPAKAEVNGAMVKNPDREEWREFKKDCKKRYDAMLASKEALRQVLERVW